MDRTERIAMRMAEFFHAGHYRPHSNEPYVVHLASVAALVRSVPTHEPWMLQAAWGHDLLEDTQATLSVLRARLDPRAVEAIVWLSDHQISGKNRVERKARIRDKLIRAPGRVQTVKVADVIDNSRSIAQRNPDFARVYLPEQAALVDVLDQADPVLLGLARRAIDVGISRLQ